MNPRRLQRLLWRGRIALYAGVVLVLLYGTWRYDLVRLPAAGCSPVEGVEPGDRLVVDVRERRPGRGAIVLFRTPDARLAFARVEPPPPSAPAEVHDAVAAGALWLVADRAGCPGPDSRRLGPLGPDAVAGTVVGRLPW